MARDIDGEISKLFQFVFIEASALGYRRIPGLPGNRSPDQDEFPDHHE